MIISPNFLNSIAQSYKITEDSQKSILSENKNYFFESGHTDINRNYDIFLSHSYLDKVHVLALVKLFNIHQFSVYVDWLEDNQLNREDVNVHTANLLRNRMKHSKCLSYLTTENITKSKWCPCKSWNLTLIAGVFALTPEKINNWYICIVIFCIDLCFWWLDSFFILQEQKYRDKYEWVIQKRLEG